jgi:hypothetical protein
MWAAGLKLPTQASDRQAVCFCGAGIMERLPPGVTAPKNKQAPPVKMGQAADGSHEALGSGWMVVEGVIHSRGKPTNIVEDVE